MKNRFWTKTVGSLIGAIWLYTLADIAGSVAGFVNGLLSPGGMMGMIASLMGEGGGSAFGLGDLLESLFPLLVMLGYWLFYSALTNFMRLQRSDADREAVGKVRMSYILMVIAIVVGYLWLPGRIAALVLVIVAYVKLLSGYRALKHSTTFPDEARRGAGILVASTVWLLVGYVIGIIPIVGDAIESVIGLVVFFSVLAGWGRIRRGAPELNEAEAAELETEEASPWTVQKKSKTIGFVLLALFGMALVPCLWRWCGDLSYGSFEYGSVWILGKPYPMIVIIQILLSVCMFALSYYLSGNRKLELPKSAKTGLFLMAAGYTYCWIFPICLSGIYSEGVYMNLVNYLTDLLPSVVSYDNAGYMLCLLTNPLLFIVYIAGAYLFVRGISANLWVKIVFLAGVVFINSGLVYLIPFPFCAVPSENAVCYGLLFFLIQLWLIVSWLRGLR